MRIVASIPHPHCRISIFSWNEKYIVELEIGQFKQTYKILQDSVNSLDEVKALISEEFVDRCMTRFYEMRDDFARAYREAIPE